MNALQRFIRGDLLGVHLAVNVFFATAILWLILYNLAGLNPIWAVSSMVASVDPQVSLAYKTLRGRIINALLGCATGMVVLVLGGSHEWELPVALAATVLLTTYVVKVQVMWRQAPITAALVIASGLEKHSKLSGVEIGLRRVGEVLLGCVVGLIVTWIISMIWPVPEPGKHEAAAKQQVS